MSDKPRRPRVSPELASRIDVVRGDVPFERWVRRALEAALGGRAPSLTQHVAENREIAEAAAAELAAKPASPVESRGVEVDEGGSPKAEKPETPLPSIARRRQW